MSVEWGGKTIYGASVGILMLDSHFPRVVGDIGNAHTWSFPVQYKVVRGATPDKVVRQNSAPLKQLFIDAAKELVANGADGITTTCGFLSLMQNDISAAAQVPVATSSLMQVPWVQALLPPNKRVGILTISKSTLTDQHLLAANVPLDTPIASTEHGRHFTNNILSNTPYLDIEGCRQDNLDAAQNLVKRNDNIGAIVLECTNMTPFAADIRKLTGLPVYSIYTFVNWFQSGLQPRRFSMELNDPIR